MPLKKYSSKFWITFVLISTVFLCAWFAYWEMKHQGLSSLRGFFGVLPIEEETRNDFETVLSLAESVLDTDGKEKTFLILFQNNLELRPGGGFIGSFGILKVRDGKLTHFSVHDTGNFDGRIPDTIVPPYPMKETLKINSWKLRDSNYSPDFPSNAKQAETFYLLGQGEETFDGVIAVTANVLTSFLSVIGPVTIEGFPGTYGTDNAIVDLEYQVERGYRDQAIAFGERKSVMGLLGQEILHRAETLPLSKKYELFRVILDDLHQKDIQLLFVDEQLQEEVHMAGWDGAMDALWKYDYLFLVDANLNSFKSDYFMERSYAYTVDFSVGTPRATLSVTYKNTALARDWFAKDYQTFLRAYVPQGSYLNHVTSAAKDPVYGEFLGKKYFGVLVQVPITSEKTVMFEYALPANMKSDGYDLKIEKQAGMPPVPVIVTVLKKDGTKEEKSFVLDRTIVWSDVK